MKTSTREAIIAALKGARDLADAAENGGRDLTEAERAQVTEFLKTATNLRKGAEDQDSLRKQLSDLSDGLGMTDPADPDGKPTPGGYTKVAGKSLGQSYVDSPEFKALIASAPDGRFSERARVQSAPFGVKDLLTGADHATSAGALLVPQQLGLLDPFFQRPLTIRQLVTNGTTETDTIDYVQLASFTNNAAPVAEAVTSGVIGSGVDPDVITTVQGGLKPESAMEFIKQTTTVKTIAHWMPATKRALSDAAQVRTMIDSFLRYGLEEELEDQMVAGNGVGENLLGLNSVSGIQLQTTGTDVFDRTRMARTKVRLGGRSIPTAYVMHPLDWQAVELKRDAEQRFYGAGPFNMTTPRLWGLPVIESEAIAAGTAWVADWSKAVLWDREQASIQVTDSHADFFVRNLVAILAELRVAFGVLRPSAFVKITLP